MLTGGPKSDNSLIALWIDGSVCLLQPSGDFAKDDPEAGWLNFSDGRGNSDLVSEDVLRYGNPCGDRWLRPLIDGTRSR